MVEKIIVSKIMTDEEIESKEGEYFDESHYQVILDRDADVYTTEGKLLLKIRKNQIDLSLTDLALQSYRDASKKKHENRGASAGILDRNKMANYIGDFINKGKFRTKFKSSVTGIESKQATSNMSQSNIIGFFDKPDRNLKGTGPPCRLTAYNRDYPELWTKSLPFLIKCDEIFKELIPERHAIQYQRAQETPNLVIPGTAFSTVTINYSWRTALHKDAGDLKEGFGNLIVIEDTANTNKYTGCYTGFPQYGVAVNVRTGDFLAMDVHEWHCNTEFKPVDALTELANQPIHELNGWHFNRLSVVCYLREKMIRCKDLDTNHINIAKPTKVKVEKPPKEPKVKEVKVKVPKEPKVKEVKVEKPPKEPKVKVEKPPKEPKVKVEKPPKEPKVKVEKPIKEKKVRVNVIKLDESNTI